MEAIAALAAAQRIVAGEAEDQVVAGPAVDGVGCQAADQDVAVVARPPAAAPVQAGARPLDQLVPPRAPRRVPG
jgi:hypothetical protein